MRWRGKGLEGQGEAERGERQGWGREGPGEAEREGCIEEGGGIDREGIG